MVSQCNTTLTFSFTTPPKIENKSTKVQISFFIFIFFQNEATFQLVRKDYYKEIVQGGLYIDRGISLRSNSRK